MITLIVDVGTGRILQAHDGIDPGVLAMLTVGYRIVEVARQPIDFDRMRVIGEELVTEEPA